MIKVNRQYINQFLTGGKCECTIVNNETNNSFTYKLTSFKKAQKAESFWLFVNKGYQDYIYAGIINWDGFNQKYTFVKGQKGHMNPDAQSVQVILRILTDSRSNKLSTKVDVYHLGTCGRCGRPLEDAESIKIGLGPVCRTKI